VTDYQVNGMPDRLRDALLLKGGGVVSLVGAGGKTSLMFRLARELSAAGETVLTTTTTRIFMPEAGQSRCVILADTAEEILERAAQRPNEHRHLTAAAGLSADPGKLAGLTPHTVDRLWAAQVFDWIIVEADGAAGRPLKAPTAHEPVIPRSTGWLIAVAGLSAVGRTLTGESVFRPEVFSRLSGLAPGGLIDAAAVAAVLGHSEGSMQGAPGGCRRVAFLNQADAPEHVAAARRIAEALQHGARGGIERVVCGRLAAEPPVVAVRDLRERD